jgi:hypothetical protein
MPEMVQQEIVVGLTRNAAGQVVVREGVVPREGVYAIPDGPPMCPCDRHRYTTGYGMFCLVCMGIRQYWRFSHTTSDL